MSELLDLIDLAARGADRACTRRLRVADFDPSEAAAALANAAGAVPGARPRGGEATGLDLPAREAGSA
jgi:hypothetical protein